MVPVFDVVEEGTTTRPLRSGVLRDVVHAACLGTTTVQRIVRHMSGYVWSIWSCAGRSEVFRRSIDCQYSWWRSTLIEEDRSQSSRGFMYRLTIIALFCSLWPGAWMVKSLYVT